MRVGRIRAVPRMTKRQDATPRSARRFLGPGEQPLDARNWVERDLEEIDRLITEALVRNNSR